MPKIKKFKGLSVATPAACALGPRTQVEAAKGFRRLKAHRQLPVLRAALAAHQARHAGNPDLEQQAKAA